MNKKNAENIEEQVRLSKLDEDEKINLLAVFRGEKIPSLTSDVVAKHILSPDIHPERMDYILQEIMEDASIKVSSSAANESTLKNVHSKKIISDIPAWLSDHRLSDLEIQVAAQDFIFDRADIYASHMLVLQYSVEEGKHKSELNYTNIKGVTMVVLMKKSPKIFKDYDSKRYIHRITKAQADSGMKFDVLRKMAFVQLDKAFDLFVNDSYESDENYELLTLLAMMADPNNEKVQLAIKGNKMLEDMCAEASAFSKDKEVQIKMLAEELVVADFNSNRTAGRNDAIACFVSNLKKRHPDWSDKQIQDEVDYFFTEKESAES